MKTSKAQNNSVASEITLKQYRTEARTTKDLTAKDQTAKDRTGVKQAAGKKLSCRTEPKSRSGV